MTPLSLSAAMSGSSFNPISNTPFARSDHIKETKTTYPLSFCQRALWTRHVRFKYLCSNLAKHCRSARKKGGRWLLSLFFLRSWMLVTRVRLISNNGFLFQNKSLANRFVTILCNLENTRCMHTSTYKYGIPLDFLILHQFFWWCLLH